MTSPLSTARLELERKTLRLLCSLRVAKEKRAAICRDLRSNCFRDPIHRIIFEEIRVLVAADAQRMRELLPGRITNRGFPDFDLANLFAVDEETQDPLEELCRCIGILGNA